MGSRLKKLRLESGVLQKDLAEKLNLSQQTISLYESNKRQPDNNTLITLAKFFNVSTDYILGITDIQEPINSLIKEPETYVLAEKLNTYYAKEDTRILEICDDLYELSPESQEEIRKLIKMYKL